ncbi:MAG: flippase-like domain-containing protein [Deltaproteobacteria bacterium]|nr:flippase-like domain-containing protein [Deltaproteobacteria bacterium]
MLGAGAGSVVLGLLVFGFFLRGRRAKRGAAPAEHASRLARWFDEALHGLAALESKGRAALVFALSLTMWLVTMGPGMYVFKAVGIDVTFSDVAVVMVSVTFAVAAPASPGFVGTFHAGFVLGSELVGIPRERALPVAIVVHLISQIPFILAGGVVLATGGRRALARADAPKNEPSGPGAAARGK